MEGREGLARSSETSAADSGCRLTGKNTEQTGKQSGWDPKESNPVVSGRGSEKRREKNGGGHLGGVADEAKNMRSSGVCVPRAVPRGRLGAFLGRSGRG